MFKKLIKKIGVIGIVSIIVAILAVSGTLVYAAVGKTIPSSYTVNQIVATQGLEVYSDSACINPVTALTFGSLDANGTRTISVFVKNTGNTYLDNVTLSTDLPSTNGSVAFSSNNFGVLTGLAQAVNITLTACNVAGTYNFNTFVSGN